MKFRMKPVVVEAEQWFPDRGVSGVTLSHSPLAGPLGRWGTLDTPDGRVTVWPGDWIVNPKSDLRFVVTDTDFRRQYEPCFEQDPQCMKTTADCGCGMTCGGARGHAGDHRAGACRKHDRPAFSWSDR